MATIPYEEWLNLLAERDALVEALESIASGEIYPTQIARAAIEAAKRQEEGNE